MKKLITTFIILCITFLNINAQNLFPKTGSVGIATTTPKASAILDVDTVGKGVLLPRMTKAQRDAIVSPSTSLLIYQTDNTPGFYYFDAGWKPVTSAAEVQTKNNNLFVVGNYQIPITTGDSNTVVGDAAFNFNTGGTSNCVFGNYAMAFNQGGSRNTVMGYRALFKTPNSIENTAYGYEAMMNSTGGAYNTALGVKSLLVNIGLANTAVGENTLMSSQAGGANTAVGYYSLLSTLNASFNTGIGNAALINNTNGQHNTSLGFRSMQTNTIGSYNTAIGDSADVSLNNLTNATAIGCKAKATASNQVMLGNSAVTSVKAAGNVIIYSDGRFKNHIKENVPGLEFIKLLKPVTYNYNIRALDAYITPKYTITEATGKSTNGADGVYEAAVQQKEKKIYTGFVAQDVEAAANKLGYDFSGIYKPQNDKDVYGLSYSDFVVPLVKAVQELSRMNDEKDKQIADLTERVSKMENAGIASTSISTNKMLTNAGDRPRLDQNKPNPANGSTTISYYIPAVIKSAQVIITDMNGKTIKQQIIEATTNSFTFNTGNLSSGTYTYTLYCDGKQIESRNMVVSK